MKFPFLRLAVHVLIPCLLVEPVGAIAPLTRRSGTIPVTSTFESQALTPALAATLFRGMNSVRPNLFIQTYRWHLIFFATSGAALYLWPGDPQTPGILAIGMVGPLLGPLLAPAESARGGSGSARVPPAVQRLILKATKNPKRIHRGIGIDRFVASRREPVLYLPTIEIQSSDLPASTTYHPKRARRGVPKSFERIPPVQVHFPETAVLLGSQEDSGGSGQVAQLAWLNDGTPVALKGPYSGVAVMSETSLPILVNIFAAIHKLRKTALVNEYGIYVDSSGDAWLVMDIAAGDRVGHPKVRRWITLDTAKSLIQIYHALERTFGFVGSNFQFHVSREGHIHLLDIGGIVEEGWSDASSLSYQLASLLAYANARVQKEVVHLLSRNSPALLQEVSMEPVLDLFDPAAPARFEKWMRRAA